MGKGSECVPRRIGDGCDSDTDCHKSWCINDMCSCKVGFKPMIDLTISNIRTYCKMLRIKDNCSSTLECQSVVANSNCSQGNCICNSGFFSNGYLTLCVKRRIYDSCKLNSDCIDAVNNSVCTNGACACQLGYKIVNRNESCEKRQIGDTCQKTEDCSYAVDKSVCKNEVCVCKTGYKVENENRTCSLRTIFDSCDVDTDCSSAVKHSKCFEGSCTCALGFYVTEHNETCQKCPTYLGDPCFYPGHCDQVDAVSVCNGTCACPSGYFIPRDRKNCTEDPRHIGDACFLRDSCNIIKYSRCGKPSYTCECVEGYFADNEDSICREFRVLPAVASSCMLSPEERAGGRGPVFCKKMRPKIGDRCLSDVHCTNIKNAVCGRNNNTCQCIYKYHPSIGDVECRPRMKVKLPDYPDPWLGGICDITEREPCPNWNITNQWCMPEEGRVNTRCRCLPGFANRFDEGECHEIQTYFIRFNISEELGCNKREDGPRCFIYSPFTYMKPYSNPRTRPFRVMKLRIQILGLDLALNSSDRYISSEIINMTSSETGLQVSALLQIKADFYNVINASDILDELLSHMERNDGKLGDSQLKIAKSYTDHILIDDFDECSDWNNYTSDCSPFAWCINTYGSFMCSCHYGKHDYKRDRPGRICRGMNYLSNFYVLCSGGTCETRWEWVGLALACLFILLISFIVYEVYSKKKEILKADPAYASLKRVKTLRRIQSRHSSKRKKEKPLLSLSQSIEGISTVFINTLLL
ncbi:hypothetical protein FSP39_003778 [Pinctada imbricata]|uniref:Uncharacterized protein n=1 Tax=Pinctada imbricata TaxID=66713 RepID=A0AA89C9N6_PINIB|nr:hypothetical protein FSP39_003778 [Pinctada imbricata]